MLTARQAAIRTLRLMMAGSIVLPVVLFGFASWASYRNIRQVTDERIDRSLDILHEHALKVLQSIDRTFAEIDEVMRGMSDDDIRANEQALHDRLHRIVDEMPQLQGIAVVARDGHPLVSATQLPVPKDIDLSDRDYFQAQAAGNSGSYVSGIHTPRLGGINNAFFAVSQRRAAAGKFNGVVSIAVLPSYFEGFYGRMSSDGSYFALVREDGGFLARFPLMQDRQVKLDDNSAFRKGVADGLERTIFSVDSQVDHIDRRIGYRKLAGYPLYVLAGVEKPAVIGEWLGYMSGHLIFGLPATAFLFIGFWLALRRTERLYDEADRREAAEGALRQAQRLEAIGQLTGGVAHDFNNLLTVVLGYAELLGEEGVSGDHRQRGVEAILKATGRAAELTQRLLAFSRQQILAPRPMDVHGLARGLMEILGRTLGDNIEVRLVPAEL
ncbi:MAG TPA: histidine kinase dimerization/phospho-acceptor domain-containing protein, partial [Pseudolabrys sp.]|nr:histidine kinase dimerization/phospho-acceptor domain-containing protein [Pseudolabrys sp.]